MDESSLRTKGTALTTFLVSSRMIPLYGGKVEVDSILLPSQAVQWCLEEDYADNIYKSMFSS